jgi:hypothetical protein
MPATSINPDRTNEAAVSVVEEPPLRVDDIVYPSKITSTPIHERTAAILAGISIGIFGLTVLIPILAASMVGLKPGIADFVERLASIEIGPLGAIFGFYFSDKIRRGGD